MAISPQTDLFLCKCNLQLSNKHQLTFASENAQYDYFHTLPRLEVDNISYVRKDNVIRYPAHIDSLLGYNYCYYQNENYSNKWFYAFIVNMEYVNDNCTNIYIKQDVFQTWQFDLQYLQSFVEREMIDVNQDIPGANLQPESLEIGEPKVAGTASFDELQPAYIIAFSDESFATYNVDQTGHNYNGILSSCGFLLCVNDKALRATLYLINQEGKGDKIVTVFSIPRLALITKIREIEGNDPAVTVYGPVPMNFDYTEPRVTKTLTSTPTSLDGYTPRNQKLRQYPYLYVGFNPANGTSKVFRYEDFTSGTPSFKLCSEINPNPSVYFVPQNYRGQTGDSLSDSVALNGYPTISYKTDFFNSWLAQNSATLQIARERENLTYAENKANTGLGIIGAVGSILGGAESASNQSAANVGGKIIGGMVNAGSMAISSISNEKSHELNVREQMAQVEAQKLVPDSVSLSSSNATLLGYELLDDNIFTRYNIKAEFARKIDKYFDMYGYATNELKVPNINNRPTWNYVKTLACNINGNIPQADLAEIKDMFNSGITLWHNTTNFKNYYANNR